MVSLCFYQQNLSLKIPQYELLSELSLLFRLGFVFPPPWLPLLCIQDVNNNVNINVQWNTKHFMDKVAAK